MYTKVQNKKRRNLGNDDDEAMGGDVMTELGIKGVIEKITME